MGSCFMLKLKLRAVIVYLLLINGVAIAKSGSPSAAFDSLTGDFGTVEQGKIVKYKFSVTNIGDAPLLIEKVQFSMPGMKIRVKQEIPPGKSTDAIVEWDTHSFTQQVKGQALLFLNDPEHAKVLLELTGKVSSPIDILPYPAIYLSQFLGEHEQRSLTIKNNQRHNIAITKVEPLGHNFSAKLKVIEIGKHYELNVAVPTETTVGRYREALVLHTDDPNYPKIQIEMNVLVKPDIFIVPEEIDFGKIDLAQIKRDNSILKLIEQYVLIKRKSGEMEITAFSTSVPFIKASKEPDQKAKDFRIDLSFMLDKLVPGQFNGSITLNTDDPEFPKLSIPVKGEVAN